MARRPSQARLRAQHAPRRPQRPGRPLRRRADHGATSGYAYVGHIFSKGFCVVDVRDPSNPKPVELRRGAAQHLDAAPAGHDDLLLVINNKDMFAQPELADEKNYYKGSVDHHAKPEAAGAQLVGRPAVYDISKPDEPQADRLHAGRGHRPAPPLVRRRPLGLCLGAARRLLRLHPDHHRHGRPEEADARRQVLAARHERRRRREGELADQERPLRPAPRHHPRRHRLLLAGATPASPWSTSRTRPTRS